VSVGISIGLAALIKNFWPGVFLEFHKGYFYTNGSFYAGYGDYDLIVLNAGGIYKAKLKGFEFSPFLGISLGRFRIQNKANYSTGINYGIKLAKSGFFVGLRGFYDGSGNPLWVEIGKSLF